MTEPAIQIENLGKNYRIGAASGVGSMLKRLWRGGGETQAQTFWALRDVSVDIAQGEVMGVIGHNGAGKSTLLKILSQITPPSCGRASLRGRVASLLEVGTGFHPELSGRENIYLNGAILGMRNAEIKSRFDEIVAFAEVDAFLDTPVKRYSSGMRVRLAFAVAAHLTPEILLIDEVLAVGDASFQRKCLGKMNDVAEAGRTIIFVSHNMGAISRICHRAVWLDRGQVKKIDTAGDVVQACMASGTCGESQVDLETDLEKDGQITRVEVRDCDKTLCSAVLANQPFTVRVHYRLRETTRQYRVGVIVRAADGLDIYASSSTDEDAMLWDSDAGKYSADLTLPAGLLNSGRYTLSPFLGQPPRRNLDMRSNVMNFDVQGCSSAMDEGQRPGVIGLSLPWQMCDASKAA